MKKFKFTATLLIVAILAVSVFVISSSAAETSEQEISIESYNVAFAGELHLFYAVNTSLAGEPANVGIKLSYDPSTVADREVFEARASSESYPANPGYPTFCSFGIPAKKLDDVVYATPYAEYEDGSVIYGDEVAYSVLEYCYEMILDVAPAKLLAGEITAEKCENLQNSLRSLMEYGENVQKYFEWDTENLPSDYCYIAIDGGTVNDASNVFFHKDNAPASLRLAHTAQTPSDKYFSGWLAEYVDGTTEEVGFTVSAGRSARYSPVYTAINIETFDDTTYEYVELNNSNGPGLGSDGTTSSNKFRFLEYSYSDDNGVANKALRANTNSIAYGYASNTAPASSITIKNQTALTEDNNECVYRFETKLYFASAVPNGGTGDAYGKPICIDLVASDGTSSYGTYYLHQLSGSYLTVRTPSGTVVCKSNSAFGLDKWVTLRIEIYKNADSALCATKFTLTSGKFVMTGEDTSYVADNTAFTDASVAPASVKMSFVKEANEQRDIYIDDIYFTTIKNEVLAD